MVTVATLSTIDDISPTGWDAFVASAPQGHLLQSAAWGDLKARYGWEVERVLLVEGVHPVAGAQITFRRTPLGTVGYVARGPVLPSERPDLLAPLLAEIRCRARSRDAIFLKVEPNGSLGAPPKAIGFSPSPQTLQAQSTLIVDLTFDVEQLLARMKPKTRYNLRLAARRGVEIVKAGSEALPTFHRLMVETGQRDGFAVRPLRYYQDVLECLGDHGWLLLAQHQGTPLAAIIVGVFGREAIYLYGASSNEHRNMMPTYLLQWTAILHAKEAGCARYDMWGVPPELSGTEAGEDGPMEEGQGGLWGVYRFKRGFGGDLVSYPGAFDAIYNPLRYRLWYGFVPFYQALLRWGLSKGA